MPLYKSQSGAPDPYTLFLVGMPRSGTKLLRDLLNNHPAVSIFPHETHFFPTLCHNLHQYGNITEPQKFLKLYTNVQGATFFRRMKARGEEITFAEWFARLEGAECSDILRALFDSYRERTGAQIVGDKTPSYIVHAPFLSKMIPNARFIHILRDPRDYALSIRTAWGKQIPRAVQRWKQEIRKFQSDAIRLNLEYVEVRYEDLLNTPENTLSRLCDFLEIEFSADMVTLKSATENIGNARGARSIIRTNLGRWRDELDDQTVEGIERIAGNLMLELGYAPIFQAADRNVGKFQMIVEKLADILNQLRFTAREEEGFFSVIRQVWRVARFK